MNRPDKEEGKKKKKGEGDGQTNREEEEKKVQPKKKKREGDGQTNREEEEKKERRRRSSCFTAPPLLRHRLLPFLLLLCFLSLQMMFRPSIHILAETARFCQYSRYGQYFFRYGIRGLSVPVH